MRKKYRKYQYGGILQLRINAPTMPTNFGSNFDSFAPYRNFGLPQSTTSAIQGTGNTALRQTGGTALNAAGNLLGTYTSSLFGDSELGQLAGGLVGGAVGNAFSTMGNNLLKGTTLTQGLGQNVGSSVAGAAIGIGANYLGKGITKALGNTKAARGIGTGTASLVGNLGGLVAGNLISKAGAFTNVSPGALIGQAVGAGLSAAFGKSHAYGGKYGKVTQGMDMAYDMIQSGVGFVPGVGQLISGAMAVNKGLMNAFGSTDGMTKQDAILASPLNPLGFIGNWINMAKARTTNTFNNQSWLNTERTDSFMQNSYGNLAEKFAKAREEAGKVYGTFSKKAYRRAQDNINFSNDAYGKILAMTDLNEWQNIRANDMASINNMLYQLMIQGGIDLIARGKSGMKLLYFATTGNYQDVGMRLLSRAALNSSGMKMLSNAAI